MPGCFQSNFNLAPQVLSCLFECNESFSFSKGIGKRALDGFLTLCLIPLHGCVRLLNFFFLILLQSLWAREMVSDFFGFCRAECNIEIRV